MVPLIFIVTKVPVDLYIYIWGGGREEWSEKKKKNRIGGDFCVSKYRCCYGGEVRYVGDIWMHNWTKKYFNNQD